MGFLGSLLLGVAQLLLPLEHTSCGHVHHDSPIGEDLWALLCFHFLLQIRIFHGDSIQIEI